jgi:8-oxo-dGTP pyrophosphatase MutT (NUDIX family)
MDKFKEIRPIVLGIVKKDNKILVSKGYDKVKDEIFYRSIGGGIEFLENSKEALKREFKEELNIEIGVGEFLGISENIFTYNGKNAHELILFYNVNIKDEDYKEKYHIIDDNCETDAVWLDVEKFKNRELKIYPEQVFKYLD